MAKRERENKRVKSGKRRKRFENVRRKGKRGERKARRENEKIGNTEEGINKRGIARREIALRGCRVDASIIGENFCSK